MAGRIRDEDIALVRERSAVDEVVGEYLQLRNAGGDSLKGLCPFHDEKTPSFNVTPSRGLWYCFSCTEGGDVIKFVQRIDNLSFAEAVERLAARAGIELRYEQGGHVPGQEHRQRRRLIEAHRAAAEFYSERIGSRRCRGRPRLPVRARIRGGRLGQVRRRLRPGRVGRADPAPARPRVHRRRTAPRRAGPAGQARPGGHVPQPADLADQGPGRGRDRVRRPQARRGRQRAQVPEHAGDAAVQEERGALRRRPGQAGHRAAPPGGHRGGLHRRDGLPPVRDHHGRGDQRDLVRRRPHQDPAAAADGHRQVPRRGHLHLRRRRGRAAGGRARVQVRGRVRHADHVRRAARRPRPVRPAAQARRRGRPGPDRPARPAVRVRHPQRARPSTTSTPTRAAWRRWTPPPAIVGPDQGLRPARPLRGQPGPLARPDGRGLRAGPGPRAARAGPAPRRAGALPPAARTADRRRPGQPAPSDAGPPGQEDGGAGEPGQGQRAAELPPTT